MGVNEKGSNLKFYFVNNKIDAVNIRNPYLEIASGNNDTDLVNFTPKEGKNNPPIIKVKLEQIIKAGSFTIKGKVIDNEQEAPPYLYIDEEKVDVKKDGSFEFPLFTLDDTEITVLAVDRRRHTRRETN